MNETRDLVAMVGRLVTVRTTSGSTFDGTLCSAGLGGLIVDSDGTRRMVDPSEVAEVTAAPPGERDR